MKDRRSLRLLSPLAVIAFASPATSLADTLQYWNPGGTGGDGIWGTSPGDKNWNTTAGAPVGNTFWQDGPDDVAVFQDAVGGIVTVFDDIQTTGIVQSGANYLINAGTITLVPESSPDVPFIEVQGGGTLTIDSVLDGADGLVKSGAGILVLTGTNTYDGTTTVHAGTLFNSGVLGNLASRIDINSGATFVAGGLPQFGLLTTSGPGTGTWQGDLTNTTLVAPGGEGATGALAVAGNFANSNSGTLELDIASAGHDLLTVSGNAAFGGALELNQSGSGGITPFVPIQVVAAGSYSGNFTSFTEDLEGAVWFNPFNGDIIRVTLPAGGVGFSYHATSNEISTWNSLYEDVIDPGITNITRNPGGDPAYEVSSGIADGGNPDLMWALTASLTPGGLNGPLLDRLSPEVYSGFSDYAMQANREHLRTALDAPALAATPPPRQSDSKAGPKDATVSAPERTPWETFAAVDYFNAETHSSENAADYETSGAGLIAGIRAYPATGFQLTGWLAADDGTVSGRLIDADASSLGLGLAGRMSLNEESGTLLTAALSWGLTRFDGSRVSASATSDGWSPGRVDFDDVETDAFEFFLGVETVALRKRDLRVIPSAAIRHSSGSTHGFSESTGPAAGSPIALDVGSDNYSTTLAELSVRAEADLTSRLTVRGLLGLSAEVDGDTHRISATFVSGDRPMSTTAEGLSGDLIFVGMEADYRVTDSLSAHLGYRAEFREDAETQIGLNCSSTFRF